MAEIQNMPEYSFKFIDVVGTSLNASVEETKDKLDIQPREVRNFVVGLVNILNSINGADSISAKGFDNLKTTIQAMLNDLNTRKVDITGDFRGTLNGMDIVEADPGLSSMVADAKGVYPTLSDALINKSSKTRRLDEGITILAHRGYDYLHPENTLYAFQRALQLGADGIELDVQVTSDGVMIILHDTTLDRTTTGTGAPRDVTYNYIFGLDAGTDFASNYAGLKVPRLEDALKVIQNAKHVFVEIKDYRTLADVSMIVQTVLGYGFEDKATIMTFDYVNLLPTIRAVSKKIRVGCLTSLDAGYTYFLPYVKNEVNSIFLLDKALCTQARIDECRLNNVEIWAWTIDDVTTMKNLINMGIRGFVCSRHLEVNI